jgi:hypothetical protein
MKVWFISTNRQNIKNIEGCKTNKIQTKKNIEKVKDTQQNINRKNLKFFLMEFDLEKIIIRNDFEIVIVMITKISSYIN